MNKIAILTSGGDAPGMNAAIRSAVRYGINLGMEVYGVDRGYEGLLDGDIRRLHWNDVSDILQRGGTILRSARSKRFREDQWVDHAAKILETFGIGGLIVVGGDGSLSGGRELAKRGIKVMGTPGTIDNDLAYTDFTIGFDTAVNNILDLVAKLKDTSSSHERTTVVEVMGRGCSDLALYAGLAGGADVILIPEVEVDLNEVCRRVIVGHQSGHSHSIIMMAESMKTKGIQMSASELAEKVEEITGREARAVVPGYIQRGGSPTERDRWLASMTSAKAVELLYNDSDSKAIGIRGGKIIALDLAEALEMTSEIDMDTYRLAEVMANRMDD